MPVKVLAFRRHGVRVGETTVDADQALAFYRDVLGLPVDRGRRYVADIPGYWIDGGGRAQIHLISARGRSRLADGKRIDPAGPHVALAVPDVQEATRELERMGVEYWSITGVTGPSTEQVFVTDPHGNVIERHEARRCRRDRGGEAPPPAAPRCAR